MKKTNAARILDRANIEYELIRYDVDPVELGAERVAEKTGEPIRFIYKTLVLAGDKTGIVVACIPGSSELDLKAIARYSGNKKCAMVPMKQIQELTGYIRGGCSPLGMKTEYPIFLDQTALNLDYIVISAGVRGTQLKLNPQDLVKLSGATCAAISTPKSQAVC